MWRSDDAVGSWRALGIALALEHFDPYPGYYTTNSNALYADDIAVVVKE
jgi:hypothetical protein